MKRKVKTEKQIERMFAEGTYEIARREGLNFERAVRVGIALLVGTYQMNFGKKETDKFLRALIRRGK